jgi:hypothetical protein
MASVAGCDVDVDFVDEHRREALACRDRRAAPAAAVPVACP